MTARDWHGWSRQDSDRGAMHVGMLPGRKSVCLYTVRGSVLDVLAYFRDEDHAWDALAWLDDFAGQRVADERITSEAERENERLRAELHDLRRTQGLAS
jgi:hypothetical protein